jgi:hypothetical protein
MLKRKEDKKMKKLFLALFFLVFLVNLNYAQEEQLTITTYYPSPVGVYRNLRLYPTTQPDCDTITGNNRGTLYYNDSENKLYLCKDTGWTEVGGAGGYWTLSGSQLYTNDLNWNVGIGTQNPQARLHLDVGVIVGAGDLEIPEIVPDSYAFKSALGNAYFLRSTALGCSATNAGEIRVAPIKISTTVPPAVFYVDGICFCGGGDPGYSWRCFTIAAI